MKKSACPVCREPVFDMAKRFDETLGYICPGCHGFLLHAEKVLRRVGIEGSATEADKSNSNPETP